MTDLRWLTEPTESDRAALHRLVAAVAASGGAVGWLTVPSRDECDAWLDGLPGDARLLTAYDGSGTLQAAGYWARFAAAVTRHNAEIRKVMVHPEARGLGLGRAVTAALVEDCRDHGIEVVALDCRGNNHGALAMYAGLGFVVSGRRPDWIAVGAERFDQVLLHRDLRTDPAPDPAAGSVTAAVPLVRHGGRREGPGSS